MSWQDEFPDFDISGMPEIPEGFEDQSWHNDACPHFANVSLGIAIWVDYPNAKDREFPEQERFNIQPVDADGAPADGECILMADDWTAILQKVADIRSEMERQTA